MRNGKGIWRLRKPQVVACHDIAMAAASFVLALYLRLGEALWQRGDLVLQGTALFALVAAVVFARSGVYRGTWRYASLPDAFALARAATFAILLFLPAIFLLTRAEDYPRSAIVINWFTLMALTCGPRLLYRIVKDGGMAHVLERAHPGAVPVVLLGADDEAEQFIRAMERDRAAPYVVCAIVDPSGRRGGRHIRGVAVHDGSGGLAEALAALRRERSRRARPRRLVLTGAVRDPREALAAAEAHGMALSRLGQLTAFADGAAVEGGAQHPPAESAAAAHALRPLAIEDLLGRPQTSVCRRSVHRLVNGRRVLVTGAGGTIGGELARQIAAFAPARLALLELSEPALYEIDMEIARRFPGLERRALLRDIRDRQRLERTLACERPEIVFHAAALKQVPLAEANPGECVLTNVAGTVHVAAACRRAGTAAMVLISTDKAVNPASVMGATKRLAELWLQGQSGGPTRFATVRFGNVLGSAGSVVPLFRRQLAEGGPLTVTHSEATRFMMSVREAVELVLQASALDEAPGNLFVLDMGAPVRIQDMARQLVRLAGRMPDEEVEIVFTGLRPGEKLHEELTYGDEELLPSGREGIAVAKGRQGSPDLATNLQGLLDAARRGDEAAVMAALRAALPEYAPAPDRSAVAGVGCAPATDRERHP